MKPKMKLKFVAAGAALCALGMTGCTHETDEAGAQAGKQVVMTMQSTTDVPQTRADYTEDGTDITKMNFSWQSGDKMSVVVNGVGGNENCELTADAAGKSAPFSGTVTTWTGTKDIYAFYPFSSTTYAISNGTAALTLPNPQLYTVGGAISNSFMVGAGTATATDDAINASVSMKQVMSIIKLNITDAPAKVMGVKLKCAEALFPTTATVTLSDATITNPGTLVSELSMTVTDATTVATKAVSFAMFPTNLTGKKVQVEVTFEGGKSITIEKDGTDFVRNMHYVMDFDGAPITWATGNLVAKADGSGCEISSNATEKGLFFQFGSLVGWSTTGTAVIVVKPTDCTITKWQAGWQGDPATENTVTGTGDPCKYYLGSTWRLPTRAEYYKLLENNGYPSTGPWKWENSSATNSTKSLIFPASGYRNRFGVLDESGTAGYYWSATTVYNDGVQMYFHESSLGTGSANSYLGYSVRCVQNASN